MIFRPYLSLPFHLREYNISIHNSFLCMCTQRFPLPLYIPLVPFYHNDAKFTVTWMGVCIHALARVVRFINTMAYQVMLLSSFAFLSLSLFAGSFFSLSR